MIKRSKRALRAMRIAQRQQEPRAIVLALAKEIRGRLDRFNNDIREILFPALEQYVIEGAVTRVDARIPSFIQDRLSILDLKLLKQFDHEELDEKLGIIASRVSIKNANDLKRIVGVSIRKSNPGIAAYIDGFREKNVAKIRSLAGSQLVELTKILEQQELSGATVRSVAKQIEDTFEVTKTKANLLARDQILTLNADIDRQRQTNLGIEEYIWTTSGDERVRSSHDDLDGTTQRWDTPPQISDDGRTGHPGEDYQCRCTAFPVLPELA